ncbi:MAG: hypothetical protein DWQ37_21600 [Planctomycetota bacterium]|nr:MAG: hypothetical protein DWQ37_21600 [Planctomycetota bacterium]
MSIGFWSENHISNLGVTMLGFHLLLVLGVGALLAFALVPPSICNARPRLMRTIVSWAAGVLFAVALAAFLSLVTYDASATRHVSLPADGPIALSLHYDSVAGIMLVLVSFVGLVVCNYSVRYLDGDPGQGSYFRWVAITIGAVSSLVLSGNLLLFFASWVATSFGLHHLLLHYRDRPAAQRAAWTKFKISRLGDAFLLTALALVYWNFGTLELDELFAAVQAPATLEASQTTALGWIGWLFMLGAVTKSAQLPLHSWLPETLDTPTPVSALMHAGVVNAGGYLVIRMSPLISMAPSALVVLTLIGAATAAYAGVVMLTQSSVKKALAYSTVAQMGFMMLQCGLGAFTAAMLHIVAHSLYKAYAFLASGNVLNEMRAMNVPAKPSSAPRRMLLPLAVAAGVVAAIGWGSAPVLGYDYAYKPGGVALLITLFFALAMGLQEAFVFRRVRITAFGIGAAVVLAGLYVAACQSMGLLIGTRVPDFLPGPAGVAAAAAVASVFFALFVLQATIASGATRQWLEAMYVHALNGFYADAILRRVLARQPVRG